MSRFIKSGSGWRIGWDSAASQFRGLVGSDEWSVELTEAEFNDVCRLIEQLTQAMTHAQTELMDEEAIACEIESELIWLEAEGYPHAYSLHLIVLQNRQVEAYWPAPVAAELLQAFQSLKVF